MLVRATYEVTHLPLDAAKQSHTIRLDGDPPFIITFRLPDVAADPKQPTIATVVTEVEAPADVVEALRTQAELPDVATRFLEEISAHVKEPIWRVVRLLMWRHGISD